MRNNGFRPIIGLAVVCLALSLGHRVLAGPAAPRDLLVQAYVTLEQADHDYKGHRVAAMKQIQAAARLLGEGIGGHGKGHEKQGVSDEQLRTAQGLLEQARSGLSGKPLKHVNRALHELSIALAIR